MAGELSEAMTNTKSGYEQNNQHLIKAGSVSKIIRHFHLSFFHTFRFYDRLQLTTFQNDIRRTGHPVCVFWKLRSH